MPGLGVAAGGQHGAGGCAGDATGAVVATTGCEGGACRVASTIAMTIRIATLTPIPSVQRLREPVATKPVSLSGGGSDSARNGSAGPSRSCPSRSGPGCSAQPGPAQPGPAPGVPTAENRYVAREDLQRPSDASVSAHRFERVDQAFDHAQPLIPEPGIGRIQAERRQQFPVAARAAGASMSRYRSAKPCEAVS